MSLYNLKKIQIISVLKVSSVICAVLGALFGLFIFIFSLDSTVANLNPGLKLLSWATFVALYTITMMAVILVVIWLYNLNGGIVISLEPKDK